MMLRTVFALTLILAAALASCWLDAPCRAGWLCLGPCATSAACGTGCVCVGTTGGVGHCVSR